MSIAAVVLARADFRRHVMHRADGDRLPRLCWPTRDGLAQAVVADLDVAVFVEDVAGLQVAMNDAAVVQEGQALGDLAQEERGLLRRPSPLGDSSSSCRSDGPFTNSMITNGRPWSLCFTSKIDDQVRRS